MTLQELAKVLKSRSYRATCEADLQKAIEAVLVAEGLPFSREEILSAQDRVDFLVCESLAVEIKLDGSAPSVTRQLHRYATHPRVSGLLLVTTRSRHLRMPPSLAGKPVVTVFVGRL